MMILSEILYMINVTVEEGERGFCAHVKGKQGDLEAAERKLRSLGFKDDNEIFNIPRPARIREMRVVYGEEMDYNGYLMVGEETDTIIDKLVEERRA